MAEVLERHLADIFNRHGRATIFEENPVQFRMLAVSTGDARYLAGREDLDAAALQLIRTEIFGQGYEGGQDDAAAATSHIEEKVKREYGYGFWDSAAELLDIEEQDQVSRRLEEYAYPQRGMVREAMGILTVFRQVQRKHGIEAFQKETIVADVMEKAIVYDEAESERSSKNFDRGVGRFCN